MFIYTSLAPKGIKTPQSFILRLQKTTRLGPFPRVPGGSLAPREPLNPRAAGTVAYADSDAANFFKLTSKAPNLKFRNLKNLKSDLLEFSKVIVKSGTFPREKACQIIPFDIEDRRDYSYLELPVFHFGTFPREILLHFRFHNLRNSRYEISQKCRSRI